jgi:hypothetical protein
VTLDTLDPGVWRILIGRKFRPHRVTGGAAEFWRLHVLYASPQPRIRVPITPEPKDPGLSLQTTFPLFGGPAFAVNDAVLENRM